MYSLGVLFARISYTHKCQLEMQYINGVISLSRTDTLKNEDFFFWRPVKNKKLDLSIFLAISNISYIYRWLIIIERMESVIA